MSLPFLSGCNTGGYAGVPVSFHPGFYLTQVGTAARAAMITDITDFACFRGAMFRYSWNELEVADGDYSGITTHILPDLDDIAAISSGANRKRVVIMIHLRTTSSVDAASADDVVPTFMVSNPTYNGGQWTFSNDNASTPAAGGKMICLWDADVQARFALCIQAVADAVANYQAADSAAVDYNPVEAIVLSESSIGGTAFASQPYGATFPTFWEEMYSEGYYRLCLNLKTSFPRHTTVGFANFPKDGAGRIIDGGTFYTGATPVNGLIVEGIGIGSPNTVEDDPGYDPTRFSGGYPGTREYYPSAAGVVPIMPSWQKPDYVWSRLDTPPNDSNPLGFAPTAEDLYLYCKNELFATHIIMTRSDANDPVSGTNYWTLAKNYFNSSGLYAIRNGGLASAKPSAYGTVDTD